MKKYIALLFLIAPLFAGCNFLTSFSESDDDNIALSFDKNKTSLSMGAMDIVNLSASRDQNSADIRWEYDDTVIFAKTDNYSAVITGLNPGTATLTAICGSNRASCAVTVTEDLYAVSITNPYVYASADYVEVKPNETVKISAALFGGTAADINGYTWTTDNSSVASLSAEGNYCWITGLNDGTAKVTVRHNKAAYGYSVLVNCSRDGTGISYITTTENIVTINLSETCSADFAVDLMNPPISEYAGGFTYTVVGSSGAELSPAPVAVSGAGSLNVSLQAYTTGECYIRCSHLYADYTLDVLVRVIENAETAYIEPSETLVTVSDEAYRNISLSLVNYSGTADPDLFRWDFSENAASYIDCTLYNGSSYDTGDTIAVRGKKTGTVKITVSYPGIPSRDIVVLVRNISTDAADAKTYITTSQNYIRMAMTDEPYQINVYLKNGDVSDIGDLHWTITNSAADGSSGKVVNWKSGNGTSSSRSARSAVIEKSAYAYAVIEPVSPGTAYIDISHPKAMYSTRITAVVTEEKTVEVRKSYLNLATPAVISLQNGQTFTAEIAYTGSGSADDTLWSADGSVSVAGNGTSCAISAPAAGSGGSRSTVTARHPDADYPVTFTVVCYDTQSDYDQYAVRSVYSYSTSETVETGKDIVLYLETAGFDTDPVLTWNVFEGSGLVSLYTENGNKNAVVTGLKPGTALIRVSCPDCADVVFSVTVAAAGIIDTAKDCYLSTTANVLYFEDIGEMQNIGVELYNASPANYPDLSWTLSGTGYDISANNNTAAITSLAANASATLTVTHPLSENELVIHLRTGGRYEFINEDSCYISTNREVFELFAGQDEVSLVASVNHTEESDTAAVTKGFVFSCDDTSVADISYVNYSNTCYIRPLKNGTAKITVSHPDADFEKEVVVIVNQAPDASSIPYITTSGNVITAVQGNYTAATVTLMNSDSISSTAWHWTSLDPRIADVVANNGTSAMISANSPGTVEIKVSHDDCLYSLNLIIIVLDALSVTDRPYISTDANIITLQKDGSTTLSAEMIGGTSAADSNYFRFVSGNSSIAMVSSSSGSAYIRGLNTGLTYITVRNSRYSDSYDKTVLVVVEDKQEDGIYISASQNILKLKPDETALTTVTATLVNGLPTDGENFIWWADDYNLVGLTAVAEKCSVVPAGRSGTTKIHVKHEKASKQCDILVMVSSYDAFAFSATSALIDSEKLYFYPLQVPSVEEAFEVQYSSSNENVCIIQGSNSVAWVCGRDYGTASLTASMVASDGTVLATAEMLVTVTVTDPVLPVMSLGNSILTVEAGTSRVFSAAISGENISETEKFNLKWSVKNRDPGISLLNESPDKTAYGSDCYATFNYGGEYVLVCEHEATGVSAELYLIVEEKGEMGIELNSSLETVYKDDGSITLTATLINASDTDYKNIEWSAVKVGGQSVVSVSKAKGAKCTVTPKNVGQTTVIAKLPNGKTATCTVIVKANTEILLDVGALHVIPGYTEVINYRTNPENATINWYTQMTSSSLGSITEYFSIADDPVKKQLRVTGLKDYPNGAAGTVTATMVGASSANLPNVKVYVEYNVEVRLEDTKGNILTQVNNTCPDTANAKVFNIVFHPADMDIDIKKNGRIIACIPSESGSLNHTAVKDGEVSVGDVSKSFFIEDGVEKCRMSVALVPHTETECTLSVTGTLPSDKSGSYSANKEFYYSAYYDEYDIEINTDLTPSGAFSRFENGMLYLGDGEEAVFYFRIKNENAKGTIESLDAGSWTNTSGSATRDLEYNSGLKPGKTRKEIAKDVFAIENPQIIETQNIAPQAGLIYFTADPSADANTTVYHLSHNWDYYKDLPDSVTGSNWESYKGRNNYSDNFISGLRNAGVDYWIVNRELVMELNGTDYYAISHSPAVNMINARWDKGYNKNTYYTWICKKHTEYKSYVKLFFNGTEVFYIRNGGSDGTAKINLTNSAHLYYKTCIPYVVSTEELMKNQALVRPNEYSAVGYDDNEGFFFFDLGTASSKIYLNKLLHDYMAPTVCKDTAKTILGTGTLAVKYTDGKGDEKKKELAVQVEKRLCEAYTNRNWKTEATRDGTHWVMSEELFDVSSVGEKSPYFKLGKTAIEATTSEIAGDPSVLTVPYSCLPSDAVIKVSVPPSDGAGTLEMSGGYSSMTESAGTKTYVVSNHESTNGAAAAGKLRFSGKGAYTGTVTVAVTGSGLSQTNTVSFDISSENCFVPVITSRVATANPAVASRYSEADTKARMLVVGDGETVTGYISNLDTSSVSAITGVTYEALTASSIPAADSAGKTQNSLVTCGISASGGRYTFTVKHAKDYGYFASSSGGVTDEFYGKSMKLSDITVDETALVYETVYNTDETVNEAATAANRQKALLDEKRRKLHEQKTIYAGNSGGTAMTSCTLPYHYDNYDLVEERKTYGVTPVGRILVEYDAGDVEEIFVCVKITQSPCSETAGYGYDVPSTYYLGVSQ